MTWFLYGAAWAAAAGALGLALAHRIRRNTTRTRRTWPARTRHVHDDALDKLRRGIQKED